MNAYLLSLLFLWTMPASEVPNYYPNFISARDAAKSSNKDILVFFSKKSCGNCESAWKAYEKENQTSGSYISTRLDTEDFDGGVFFEQYELTAVPCWIILTPDGQVKEKWNGGWKDASGNPTLYIEDQNKKPLPQQTAIVTKEPILATPEKNTPAKDNPKAIENTPLQKANQPKTEQAIITSSTDIRKNETTSSGYVLQAGYFGSETNAHKLVSDLKGKGYQNYNIKPTQQNGSKFYRVISSSFDTESDAIKELQSLAASGIKATVKKVSEL